MLFDPTNLPDRKWLKLSEIVNFLALGEAQDVPAMKAAGTPSERLYSTRAEQAWIRCLEEAGTDPHHTPFVRLINSPGFWNVDPLAPHLDECRASWTQSGQCLFDWVVGLERTRGEEIEKREAARMQVEHWFASGEVAFEGYRDGRLERINAQRLDDVEIFWEFESIWAVSRDETSGHLQLGTSRRRSLEWRDVRVERASLMAWLKPPLPDPAQFDPMLEVYWTLPMAVAWIRSNAPDAVREQWDAWLKKCGERRIHVDGYYYLEPRRRASLAGLIAASPEDQEAWKALRHALQNSELTATAFLTATGERVGVPPSAWAIAEDQTTGHPNTAPTLRQPCAPLPDESVYTDFLLKSGDVQRLWPAESARAAAGEGSVTPVPNLMTPGRLPRAQDWQLLKPLALKTYKEKGPYDRVIGFTQKAHIELIWKRAREEHPEREWPKNSWLKQRLRKLKPELDKIEF